MKIAPIRCADPALCKTNWHWGRRPRSCDYYRNEIVMDYIDPVPLPKNRMVEHPFDAEKREARRLVGAAAHLPEPTTGPIEAAIGRNAERQLMMLSQDDFRALGFLLSTGVYSVNEALRSGHGIQGQCPHIIDAGGYTSIGNFVAAAMEPFDSLGCQLVLDKPLTLFRGVGILEAPDEFYPDFGDLSSHIVHGMPWTDTFTDSGFGFATSSSDTALCYQGDDNTNGYPAKTPALIELRAKAGLCVPAVGTRSRALFRHTFDGDGWFSTRTPQVVFPPETGWRILGVQQSSDYGVPLIQMEQI